MLWDVCVCVGRAGFHVFRCAVQGSVGWRNGPHINLTQNWGLDTEATMRVLVLFLNFLLGLLDVNSVGSLDVNVGDP